MCKESVQLQIEKLKICRRGSRCPEYAELGHFTLLFCRERLGNVPLDFKRTCRTIVMLIKPFVW